MTLNDLFHYASNSSYEIENVEKISRTSEFFTPHRLMKAEAEKLKQYFKASSFETIENKLLIFESGFEVLTSKLSFATGDEYADFFLSCPLESNYNSFFTDYEIRLYTKKLGTLRDKNKNIYSETVYALTKDILTKGKGLNEILFKFLARNNAWFFHKALEYQQNEKSKNENNKETTYGSALPDFNSNLLLEVNLQDYQSDPTALELFGAAIGDNLVGRILGF